jgi:hypothetical protein
MSVKRPAAILIVCETNAAITTHLRVLDERGPLYRGGVNRDTLCGMRASWDTRIPIAAVRCRDCIEARNLLALSLLMSQQDKD